MSSHNARVDAGWDEHERAQRRRLAQLPLAEKLRWLEEADELVRHLRGAHRSAARHRGDDARGDVSN